MRVTVDVVGEETYDVELADGTYADLLDAVGLSTHEASVLVEGRPVPEDQPIESSTVTVLRLVRGG
ncbi:Sulfur transfer protein involved in thiamine biosynthesis [Halanaeroarchaeum sp. HSR-CO]|uniref:ubiquitin-like small modifier protein SAMP2 n=1 Tax=Halanaeroarchaeum sp. HSR-CO TaxID=2866382 RepID=UPI00217E367B|nr:ubiquitin-like small modifier protein 2 [Halanaeroarchaeum sp. HSR-CO]UWG49005.1 Sulfur transfer protein involved in thiamine biosynthesis [Halanaeroarchaeum sp. HSR-CO]